ncbi:MAG: DUF927 domain-containing protein [Acidobacteria bacterium]|nr:DUF927 domain-containing protein [Acidobacteriota bacterium]
MKPWTPQEIRRFYAQRLPKLKAHGKEWRGPCPIHKGTRDSFAVNAATGQAYCHSECARGWSMVELEAELAGFDTAQACKEIAKLVRRSETTNGHGANGTGRRIVATYPYVDEAGVVLFEVVRFDPKDFRQRRSINGKHVYSLGDVRRVVFRLPQVIAANEVLIVEGEKDVLSLEKLGFIATTSPMGAGKWRTEYAEHFAGKRVVIIPDNDAPGEKHAAEVLRSVEPVAREAMIVRLPEKDATAWIENGGTFASLRAFIDEALANRAQSVPSWFRLEPDGVYFVDPEGKRKPLWICSPVKLIARTCDRNGHNWGVLVEWRDGRGTRHRWAVPKEEMKGDGTEIEGTLLNRGLDITRSREKRLLLDYLNQRIPAHVFSTSRVGWSGESFVLPEITIGRSSGEDVIFIGEIDANHLKVAGTPEDWKEHVGRFCKGNSRLVFSASCAFAGPLLELGNFDSGGFHLVGPTSCGKSTALVVGGSVIGGGGRNGFVNSWNTTANGLEAVAEAHNDLTLFLDELAQVDPKQASEVAYLLGNGSGKGRMSKSITARRKLTWTMLFLNAGEVTLAEHASTAGRKTKGGAEVRLLNIRADAGKGLGIFETTHGTDSSADFSNLLRAAAKKYYGAPLLSFLRHVVDVQVAVGERCRRFVKQFVGKVTPRDAASEIGRAAQRFGIVAAAGELASEIGLTSWDAGEAERSAATCFKAWLKERGSVRSSDDDEAIRTVRQFLERYGQSRFPDSRTVSETIVTERAGFHKKAEGDEPECFYILPEVFKKQVCDGLSYKAVAAALYSRGFLKRNEDDRWTFKVRIPALGTWDRLVSVYCIPARIFEEDD